MNIEFFKYDVNDTISDTIIGFYKALNDDERNKIDDIINLYINDEKFFAFIQHNLLINKLSIDYLIHLYNDFDNDTLIDSYDTVFVNTARWI